MNNDLAGILERRGLAGAIKWIAIRCRRRRYTGDDCLALGRQLEAHVGEQITAAYVEGMQAGVATAASAAGTADNEA